MKRKIAVIGGGAAGMMAAIQAAEKGAAVEIYERNEKVGRKLLATGNGKCNFSNMEMSRNAYYGSAVLFYEQFYPVFGVQETIDFFSQKGMLIKEKRGGLYPLSEQASTVLDILRYALEGDGVIVHTDSKVEAVLPDPAAGRLRLRISDRMTGFYDAVILACGGMAAPGSGSDGSGYQLAKQLGHHITRVVPALVQLRCAGDFWKSVAGVRTEAGLELFIDGASRAYAQGELQLTNYGISGIPVFQFSREAAYAVAAKKKAEVLINFLPQLKKETYEQFWSKRWESADAVYHGKSPGDVKKASSQTMEQFLTGISNKKINQLILRLADCRLYDQAGTLPEKKRRKIKELYRAFPVTVCAANGFEQAQVSAGGIPAGELHENLESIYVPNLYFAGEIIDMDGICGGYNLQWAWTSGALAGRAAAQESNTADSHLARCLRE